MIMKVYTPEEAQKIPKRKMLIGLKEDGKGNIDVGVVDSDGNMDVYFMTIGSTNCRQSTGVLLYENVFQQLEDLNYDTSGLKFTSGGYLHVWERVT